MDITTGQIIVSLTGIGVGTMIAATWRKLGSVLSKENHDNMCTAVRARMEINYRNYFDKKIDSMEERLKTFIFKTRNGGKDAS